MRVVLVSLRYSSFVYSNNGELRYSLAGMNLPCRPDNRSVALKWGIPELGQVIVKHHGFRSFGGRHRSSIHSSCISYAGLKKKKRREVR